jgi:hypothetical protein
MSRSTSVYHLSSDAEKSKSSLKSSKSDRKGSKDKHGSVKEVSPVSPVDADDPLVSPRGKRSPSLNLSKDKEKSKDKKLKDKDRLSSPRDLLDRKKKRSKESLLGSVKDKSDEHASSTSVSPSASATGELPSRDSIDSYSATASTATGTPSSTEKLPRGSKKGIRSDYGSKRGVSSVGMGGSFRSSVELGSEDGDLLTGSGEASGSSKSEKSHSRHSMKDVKAVLKSGKTKSEAVSPLDVDSSKVGSESPRDKKHRTKEASSPRESKSSKSSSRHGVEPAAEAGEEGSPMARKSSSRVISPRRLASVATLSPRSAAKEGHSGHHHASSESASIGLAAGIEPIPSTVQTLDSAIMQKSPSMASTTSGTKQKTKTRPRSHSTDLSGSEEASSSDHGASDAALDLATDGAGNPALEPAIVKPRSGSKRAPESGSNLHLSGSSLSVSSTGPGTPPPSHGHGAHASAASTGKKARGSSKNQPMHVTPLGTSKSAAGTPEGGAALRSKRDRSNRNSLALGSGLDREFARISGKRRGETLRPGDLTGIAQGSGSSEQNPKEGRSQSSMLKRRRSDELSLESSSSSHSVQSSSTSHSSSGDQDQTSSDNTRRQFASSMKDASWGKLSSPSPGTQPYQHTLAASKSTSKSKHSSSRAASAMDLVVEETYRTHHILPTAGYLIDTVREEPVEHSTTAQELAYERWILDTFHAGNPHDGSIVHYIPLESSELGNMLFITVKSEYAHDGKELASVKILITYEERDSRIVISSAQLRGGNSILKGSSKRHISVTKLLEYINPNLTKSGVRRIKANDHILNGLLTLTRLRLSFCHADKHFKVGVVYWAGDKDDEATMNQSGSPAFNDFVNLLGDVVQLENWDRFSGGLDITKRSMDGKSSVFTEWKGNEIMFHVAPLMECSAHQRRVHIGNDTLVVVFVDSKKPFKAEYIQSKFNQAFIVVSIETDELVISKASLTTLSLSSALSSKPAPLALAALAYTNGPSSPDSMGRYPSLSSAGKKRAGRASPPPTATSDRRTGSVNIATSPNSPGALSTLSTGSQASGANHPHTIHRHESFGSVEGRGGGSSGGATGGLGIHHLPGSNSTSGLNLDHRASPSSTGSGFSGGVSAPNTRLSPLDSLEFREEDEDSGAQGDDESPVKLSLFATALAASSLSASPATPSPLALSHDAYAISPSKHTPGRFLAQIPSPHHARELSQSTPVLPSDGGVLASTTTRTAEASAESAVLSQSGSAEPVDALDDDYVQTAGGGAHHAASNVFGPYSSLPEFGSPNHTHSHSHSSATPSSGKRQRKPRRGSAAGEAPPVIEAPTSSSTRRRSKQYKESHVPNPASSVPYSDTWYRVAVLRREGIECFKPKLPWPAVLQSGPEFREWLLTKITSGMVAAFSSPNFQDRVLMNRATFLKNLTTNLADCDY